MGYLAGLYHVYWYCICILVCIHRVICLQWNVQYHPYCEKSYTFVLFRPNIANLESMSSSWLKKIQFDFLLYDWALQKLWSISSTQPLPVQLVSSWLAIMGLPLFSNSLLKEHERTKGVGNIFIMLFCCGNVCLTLVHRWERRGNSWDCRSSVRGGSLMIAKNLK